jgi:hypothetical protein
VARLRGAGMKPIDIAEARRLYGKTTQGQWRAVRGELLQDGPESIAFFETAAADSDADFAAWSHNNTPAMLEELERLESLLQLCSDISGCLANLTRCRSETNGT